jgi:hypothetical protein
MSAFITLLVLAVPFVLLAAAIAAAIVFIGNRTK